MRIGEMYMSIKLHEMAKYEYTLEEVLDYEKNNKNSLRGCNTYEIYYAYIGRYDQPGVYDKRPCVVIEDLGENVLVAKITSKSKNSPRRYLIKNYRGLNIENPSYIKLDEELYTISKKWLILFCGDIKYSDALEIEKLIGVKKYE